jgi:hypothetical protein
VAAIIQSESVFIEGFSVRPSGRFQANATGLVDVRIGKRRVADIRTMIRV